MRPANDVFIIALTLCTRYLDQSPGLKRPSNTAGQTLVFRLIRTVPDSCLCCSCTGVPLRALVTPCAIPSAKLRRSWTPRPVLTYSCSLPLLVLRLWLVHVGIAGGLLAARLGCSRCGLVWSPVAPRKMLNVKEDPCFTSFKPMHSLPLT